MIIPSINFIPYQPFDLVPFLKVTPAISIVTRSKYNCMTKFNLLSGAVIFISHVIYVYQGFCKIDCAKGHPSLS